MRRTTARSLGEKCLKMALSLLLTGLWGCAERAKGGPSADDLSKTGRVSKDDELTMVLYACYARRERDGAEALVSSDGHRLEFKKSSWPLQDIWSPKNSKGEHETHRAQQSKMIWGDEPCILALRREDKTSLRIDFDSSYYVQDRYDNPHNGEIKPWYVGWAGPVCGQGVTEPSHSLTTYQKGTVERVVKQIGIVRVGAPLVLRNPESQLDGRAADFDYAAFIIPEESPSDPGQMDETALNALAKRDCRKFIDGNELDKAAQEFPGVEEARH